jgi:stage V sporulation protein SpoVS
LTQFSLLLNRRREHLQRFSLLLQEVAAQQADKIEYKVSAKNHDDEKEVAKLAGAIATMIRKGKTVLLRCVGPYAIYKSARAIVIAKGYVFANGILIESVPSWLTITGEGKDGSDISVLAIEVRSRKA